MDFITTAGYEERAICPECSHTRKKKGEKCLAVNRDEGVYYCHHCGASGKLEQDPIFKPRPKSKREPSSTQRLAISLWACADRDDRRVANHPYVQGKKLSHAFGAGVVTAHTKMVRGECVIVPARDIESDNVVACQLIDTDGTKQSLGPIRGHACILGNTLDRTLPRLVCEGWATGAALLHHFRGEAQVYIAFGQSNMEHVAAKLEALPGTVPVICEEASK